MPIPGKMINLLRTKYLGESECRHGWPYTMKGVTQALHNPKAEILFDDWIEQGFLWSWDGPEFRHTKPWVGISHLPHPELIPPWVGWTERLDTLCHLDSWQRSVKHLKMLFTLSEHAASWWRQQVDVPVIVLRHPTWPSEFTWDIVRYLKSPQLMQGGFYLTNTEAIAQVAGFSGTRLRIVYDEWYKKEYMGQIKHVWDRFQTRESYEVLERKELSNTQYCEEMQRSVFVAEFYAASANNRVIECIQSSVPLLCNRLPSVVEYLGSSYPMFFNELTDAEEIQYLLSPKNVARTFDYLNSMDKRFLSLDYFISELQRGLERLGI